METVTNNEELSPVAGGNSSYQSIDAFIQVSTVALTNAQLPDILPLLIARGYPEATIKDKADEIADLQTLNANQQKEYGEQFAAIAAYNAAVEQLHGDYIDHLQLARLVFKNNVAAQTALGLTGKRKVSESGYQAQAVQFYQGVLANAAYKAALATKGVTQAELDSQLAGFETLPNLSAAKAKETGEAQMATKTRDAAYDALAEWMSEFKQTAIIALRKTPQLREKLGYKE